MGSPVPVASPAFSVNVRLSDGMLHGARHVSSLVSSLCVDAGPWARSDRVIGRGLDFMVYILVASDFAYIGEGNYERRLGETLERKKQKQIEQVYAIRSVSGRLKKRHAQFLEAALLNHALDRGAVVANRVQRAAPEIDEAEEINLARLLQDALNFLSIAGCKLFDGHRSGAVRSVQPEAIDDLRILRADGVIIPEGSVELQLVHPELRCRAFAVGKRIWVAPTSHYAVTARRGLSSHNLERRRRIEESGLVEPIPDSPGRMRLRGWLDCRSAAIAATLISGVHSKTAAWQPISADPADPEDPA